MNQVGDSEKGSVLYYNSCRTRRYTSRSTKGVFLRSLGCVMAEKVESSWNEEIINKGNKLHVVRLQDPVSVCYSIKMFVER